MPLFPVTDTISRSWLVGHFFPISRSLIQLRHPGSVSGSEQLCSNSFHRNLQLRDSPNVGSPRSEYGSPVTEFGKECTPEQRGEGGKFSSKEETDLGNRLRRRRLFNTNLLDGHQAADQLGAPPEGSLSSYLEVSDEIIVNNVPTPQFPKHNANRSEPTPPEQRVLGQKDFDRKLIEAKRDIFCKGRSISLGAFRLPSRMFRSPKKKKKEKKRAEADQSHLQQQRSVRGELELVNIDQLINVDDLG